MGGKSSAPPPPAPIDAAQSAGRFLFGDDFAAGQGITDPQFQRRLIEAERTFGPEYVQNELSRQERALFGADGQTGLLGLYEEAAPITERMRADTARRQREADIGDVERLGSRAVSAIREADPERARLIRQQQGLTDELYGRAQGVTPQQRRMAEQSAREADPMQAVLGRPAQSMPYNFQTAQSAMGAARMGTPQTFSPDAGVNLALQQRGQQMEYDANVFGAQAAREGAILGGLFEGLGPVGAALIPSDIRLKTDIQEIGQHPLGVKIYSYRYKGHSIQHVGVMAQEVAQVKPEAVQTMPNGYLAVIYALI